MKMMKMKAEARLDLLRQVGVAVETWLKSAMNQVMEELENECWSNLSGHDASLSVRPTGIRRPFKASVPPQTLGAVEPNPRTSAVTTFDL